MKAELREISEKQKASWDKVSYGWNKWDTIMMDFLKPSGDEIIRLIRPHGTDYVLDIAAGTGEPGLTIATMLTGGKVMITDISDEMLEVSRRKAARRGIKNMETLACDVSEMPFAAGTFDSISCRFGFMFFPDMLMAVKEMVRVLKPGGRIATSVWNIPEKNFWVTAIGGTINRNMQTPPAPPEAPGMFRCAKAGLIKELFEQAGLTGTLEKEITGKMKCGTADVYWEMMLDCGAPFTAALNKADEAMRIKIKAEVYQALSDKFPDGNISIDTSALIVYGEK